MSSVTSAYLQLSGRSKYLLALVDSSGVVISGLHSAKSISSDLIANAPEVTVQKGTLLKDLGRQIVLYDDDISLKSPHLVTYRQVQRVKGAQTEGVSGSAPDGQGSYYNTFYVAVSDSVGVSHFARIG